MGRRKTHAEFVAEVEALVGDEYTVLDEYKNNRTKIKIRHNKCSREYEVSPDVFLRGRRCARCSHKEKKTTESFKKEVFELVGDEYTVLSEYINNSTKIKLKHSKCSYEYEVRPINFMNGNRCPKCSGLKKKTTDSFKREVFELVGEEYEVLGDYKSNATKIKMKHNDCCYVYEVTPSNFLGGSRCPRCNESKGEHRVSEYLSKMSIPYVRQHKFNDCRHTRKLSFDFAILDTNNLVKCLIEYDGKQHFCAVDIFGGETGFKYRKHNDTIKEQYCIDYNIPLIRIPYWKFENIDELLTKELQKLGVIEVNKDAS